MQKSKIRRNNNIKHANPIIHVHLSTKLWRDYNQHEDESVYIISKGKTCHRKPVFQDLEKHAVLERSCQVKLLNIKLTLLKMVF
jgi:hypothetical protein